MTSTDNFVRFYSTRVFASSVVPLAACNRFCSRYCDCIMCAGIDRQISGHIHSMHACMQLALHAVHAYARVSSSTIAFGINLNRRAHIEQWKRQEHSVVGTQRTRTLHSPFSGLHFVSFCSESIRLGFYSVCTCNSYGMHWIMESVPLLCNTITLFINSSLVPISCMQFEPEVYR